MGVQSQSFPCGSLRKAGLGRVWEARRRAGGGTPGPSGCHGAPHTAPLQLKGPAPQAGPATLLQRGLAPTGRRFLCAKSAKAPRVSGRQTPQREQGFCFQPPSPELAGCHGGRRRERRGRLVKWVRVSSFCRGGRWAPCSRREAAFCVLGPLPPLPRPWLSSLRNGKMLPQQTALSPAGSWQQDHLSPAHLSPRQGCLEGEARLGTVRLGLNFTSTIRSV